MEQMNVFEVGKQYDMFKGLGEGGRWGMGDSGSDLTVTFNNPTAREISEFKSGRIRYKMLTINNVVILLFKFGSLEWMDVPYIVHLSKPYELQEVEDGQGYACTIYLANNINGELKVLRYISFNTAFSKQLKKAIEDQRNFEVNQSNINQVFNRYSTKQLVDMAIVSGSV